MARNKSTPPAPPADGADTDTAGDTGGDTAASATTTTEAAEGSPVAVEAEPETPAEPSPNHYVQRVPTIELVGRAGRVVVNKGQDEQDMRDKGYTDIEESDE